MQSAIASSGDFTSSWRTANSLSVSLPVRLGRVEATLASGRVNFCDCELMTRLLRSVTPLLAGCAVTLLQVIMAVALLAPDNPIAERYSALVQHDSYWFMNIIDRGYQTIVPPIDHKMMEV